MILSTKRKFRRLTISKRADDGVTVLFFLFCSGFLNPS